MKPKRLQKILAEAGVASRRKAESLIAEGRVTVNGQVVAEPGAKARDGDRIAVDGAEIAREEKVYVMLHKPRGVISSAKDNFDRRTVLDLVKAGARLFPVGRLDYDSSGLILLTNDGEWANALMHPSSRVEKKYVARIKGMPAAEALARFRAGMEIDGRTTSPCRIRLLSADDDGRACTAEIALREGRNRQARKMCEAMGHPVISLKRVSIGRLRLGSLRPGQWRHLSAEERALAVHGPA